MYDYRMPRIRKLTSRTGDVAAIDTGYSWVAETWDWTTDAKATVAELPYAGNTDRIAARAMIYGTVDTYAMSH